MIKQIKIIDELQNKLKEWVGSSKIIDYRLEWRVDEIVDIYLIKNNDDTIITESDLDLQNLFGSHFDLVVLSEEEAEADYGHIFELNEKINTSAGHRRFDTLLKGQNVENKLKYLPCPVITFYSYKGGMGRSTTLAAFAMHLALNENKRVIILDCDFEAPGFTNFYLKNPGEENQRQGFIEYFIDKNTQHDIDIRQTLEKYTWEVDGKYSGQGSIRIMPAGNLDRNQPTEDFLHTHLNHYIEGLSRVDFVHENYIVKQFSEILEDLHNAFSPDVILIDSRTGFNDIIGITAFNLSKFVVGFFRNDIQSLPGLHFFLESIVKRTDIEPVIINSILPQSLTLKRSLYNHFKEEVKRITDELSDESGLDFPCFPISRNENLEILGTASEQIDDFIELIKNKELKDYKDIFENFTERLKSFFAMPDELNKKAIEDDNIELNTNSLSSNKDINNTELSSTEKTLKEKILLATKNKLDKINLYGDDIDIEQELINKQFFYRECMNDLFNIDKILVLGSKGTGKSYIYGALKNENIVSELKKRANRNDNYTFVYMVDKKSRIFKVNKFSETNDKRFQYRFWLVYTWQILVQEITHKFSGFESTLPDLILEVRDTDTVQTALQKIIANDNQIIAIEKDLDLLDKFLIEKGIKEYVTVIYDQLDEIIDPVLWNVWLPSLIDFWRYKRFNRIFGKLFLRQDLFRKLVGITNIRDLENQAINIEWSQEELYAYFFKIVFSENIDKEFWELMELYQEYPKQLIKQLRPKYNRNEQIPLEEHLLRPLVVTFFGKYVDVNNTVRMGESYEWFFNNLKNADNTISIRPFIELIKLALVDATKNIKEQEWIKPILYPLFYTNKDVRKKAVDGHFKDLTRNQIGNLPITYVFEYIDNHHEFQQMTLLKLKFDNLISKVMNKYKDKEGMETLKNDDIETLLINNGIIKKENFGRGDTFKFAYLYKYRLGLKGN